MSDWGRLGEWIATSFVASLAWASGLVAADSPPSVEVADARATVANHGNLIIGWAQQVDQPPIEQVGEEPGADVETLDAGAAPAQTSPADHAGDAETFDSGAAPAPGRDDTELLDRGSPAATAAAPTTAAPPVDTGYVTPPSDVSSPYFAEPVAAAGPGLPEGFGTGRVHVAAGSSGFPPGLGDCHVGAVTGRAYVGIDCGDDESSFVGHAPSFEDFPFVLDADFPFGGDSVLTTNNSKDVTGGDVEIFVSTGRGASSSLDDNPAVPEIQTSGAVSVQLSQRARDREPLAHVADRGHRRAKDANKGGGDDVSAVKADEKGAQTNEKARSAREDDRGKAASKEKKSKKAKNTKKQGNGQGKKGRDSEGR